MRTIIKSAFITAVVALLFSNSLPGLRSQAQTTTAGINWPAYEDQAVELMRQYLRINTSNPPGNEIEAAKFLKSIFDKYGIQNEIFEFKPSRANIVARLPGNGSKRPIILLSPTTNALL